MPTQIQPSKNKILLTHVEGSSNIAMMGYDETLEILHVQFKAGGTYEYTKVPVPMYRAMQVAPSKGEFFSKYIKSNKLYPCKKISA